MRFEPEPDTGGLKPYLHVRRDLWAKVTRTLFFDLVELGEERDVDGSAMFGVSSMGDFFPMIAGRSIEGIHVSDSSVTLERPAAESFFDRARERLTLDVPAALSDPNAPGARGDLDLNPESWIKAGVKATGLRRCSFR